MTIILSGTITCLDGQFKVSRSATVPSGWTFGYDQKIDFPNGMEIRTAQTIWHIVDVSHGSFQVGEATVGISLDNSNKKTRAEVEALFVENGFSVS